jgi:hypothetical protein
MCRYFEVNKIFFQKLQFLLIYKKFFPDKKFVNLERKKILKESSAEHVVTLHSAVDKALPQQLPMLP